MGGVWKPVICIQLFLSSPQLPFLLPPLSLPLPSPLVRLCCRCCAASRRPLRALQRSRIPQPGAQACSHASRLQEAETIANAAIGKGPLSKRENQRIRRICSARDLILCGASSHPEYLQFSDATTNRFHIFMWREDPRGGGTENQDAQEQT